MQYLDSLTPGLGLLTRFLWQYSDEPLFSSEEFAVGGRVIGRGYDNGEILGDKGMGLSAELQYLTPVYRDFSFQPYAFYDVGKVWNVDDIDENTDNEKPDLESAGASGYSGDKTSPCTGKRQNRCHGFLPGRTTGIPGITLR